MSSRRRRQTTDSASSVSSVQEDMRRFAEAIVAATPKTDMKELASTISTAFEVARRSTVEPFDGTGDVDDWLQEFEKRGKAANYNEEALKRQLRANLKGRALIWIQATEHDQDLDQLSWTQLKNQVAAAFKPATYEMDQRKAMNQHQLNNEDVLMFFEKRRLAGKKLGWTESEIMANIITTVRPWFYEKLSDKSFETLDALRTRLEKLAKQCPREDRAGSKAVPESSGGSAKRPFERESMSTNKRPAITCFACGKVGHRAVECRTPQRFRNPVPSGSRDKLYQGSEKKGDGRQTGGYNPYKFVKQNDNNRNKPRMLPRTDTANKVDMIQPYPCVARVLIEGSEVEGMLDTGASKTCMDATVFCSRIAKSKGINLEPIGLPVVAAGENELRCIGKATMRIELDKTTVDIEVVVVKDLGCELLLGRDYLASAKISIVSRDGQLDYVQQKKRRRQKKKSPLRLVELEKAQQKDSTSIKQLLATSREKAATKTNSDIVGGKVDEAEPNVPDNRCQNKPLICTTADEQTTAEVVLDAEAASTRCAEEARKEIGGQNSKADEANNVEGKVEEEERKQIVKIQESNNNNRDAPRNTKSKEVELRKIVIAKCESDYYDRLTFGGEWGTELKLPKDSFADDPTDDLCNPYVMKEHTKKMTLGEHEVEVGRQTTGQEMRALAAILLKHRNILAFNGQLGDCDVLMHEIPTGDANPINRAPFPRSQRQREAVDDQIEAWLSQGVIRESSSPWASQLVTVQKKDNTIRCCVDYRGLNSCTKKDVYPLPTREEIFASLEGQKWFSSIDLNQGYMQIRVHEPDIQKTAFKVQSGFYEFVRMPFGLTNAPATFQRLMDKILTGLKWTVCLVYLDDIMVFGSTLESHNDNLDAVLSRLGNAGLTIKPTKCAFAVKEVKFLGHIVNEEGIQMDADKVKVIVDAPAPTSLFELRSFVGLASYYRCFVENFAKIAEPLTRLVRKNSRFEWAEEQQEAFDELKRRLTSEPILCHFNNRWPVELRTDASNYAIGAVLLHECPDKKKRVIAYASRQLKGYELNYGITEKECLAIVWAIEKFRIYLQGITFNVVTDHLALTWLQTKKELNGRLMRWANKLAPYHFKIYYKSGKQHKDADYLSRLNTQQPRDEDWNGRGEEWTSEIKQLQKGDKDCEEIKESGHPKFESTREVIWYKDREDDRAEVTAKALIPAEKVPEIIQLISHRLTSEEARNKPGFKKTLKLFKEVCYTPNATTRIKEALKKQSETITINHNRYGTPAGYHPKRPKKQSDAKSEGKREALPRLDKETIIRSQKLDAVCQELRRKIDGRSHFCLRQGILMTRDSSRIVVPDALFEDVMYAMHDDIASGHCGVQKTKWKFNQKFYIGRAASKIKQYVKSCHLCQTRKQAWTRKLGLMQPLELVHEPFARIGVDTLGPFRRSEQGNIKIIVATDYMTRFAYAKAVPDETAQTVAAFLIDEIFLKYGPPKAILSDQSTTYAGKVLKQIYHEFNIRHLMASPYHPQTNGLTERLNKTLANMLSMYVSQNHDDWDAFLPYAVYAYNSVVHASTGYSPHYLLFGFEARTFSSNDSEENTEIEFASRYELMHKARKMAIEATEKAQHIQKEQYDKTRHEVTFDEQELVLLHRPRGYTGQTSKLRHAYEGPYKVLKKYSDLNYLIEFVGPEKSRRRQEIVHVSRLKKYVEREEKKAMMDAAGQPKTN